MSSYARKILGDVNSRYGAPMGRRDYKGDPDAPYKFRLFRVPLDSGGYDPGGAYWGHGEPLYCADSDALFDESEGTDYADARMFVRTYTREKAKAAVLEEYPHARFYR